MCNKIIVLCGKSSAGKDSLAKRIAENGYDFIISTTSRPIRKNESEGDPYFFMTREEFENLISNDRLIEYRKYNTIENNKNTIWYYGITKDQIKNNKSYIVVLDIKRLQDIKKIYKDRVMSFFIEVNKNERTKRAKLRGSFDEKEWNRRLKDDDIVFSKDIVEQNVDYIIKNYDLNKCYTKILTKILNLHCDDMEI